MSLYFLNWRICRVWPIRAPRWWVRQSNAQRWLTAQPLLALYFALLFIFQATHSWAVHFIALACWFCGMWVLCTLYSRWLLDGLVWLRRRFLRSKTPCSVCQGGWDVEIWQAVKAREQKAELLLREQLTETQRSHWDAWRVLFVKGGTTGRMYLIEWDGSVYGVDLGPVGGYREKYYCVHVKRDCGCYWPHADVVLSKLLMLRFNERRFLRIANVFSDVGRAGERVLVCKGDGSAVWRKIVSSLS